VAYRVILRKVSVGGLSKHPMKGDLGTADISRIGETNPVSKMEEARRKIGRIGRGCEWEQEGSFSEKQRRCRRFYAEEDNCSR
jgi:hypothetical protein